MTTVRAIPSKGALVKKILALMLIAPVLAFAATTPKRGEFDDHVRVVDYNANNVVNITTYFGTSTLVTFSDEEEIIDKNFGDEYAWTYRKGENYFWIQPKEKHADTNFTVITKVGNKKRIYHFALLVANLPESDSAGWNNANLVFSLGFNYPDKAVEKIITVAREKDVEREKTIVKKKLTLRNQNKQGMNFDYWAAGSELITPTSAKDDGHFMYLTFGNNRDIPSFFEIAEDGEESTIKTSVQDNTVVVEKMVRRLVLRKGNEVVCIVNKSFDPNDLLDNETKTVSPEIERVLVEGQE